MVANPFDIQPFPLNINSWVNPTLKQPHLAEQRGHFGGPPLNPSAKLDKTYSIGLQISYILQTKTTTKTSTAQELRV